MDTTAVDHLRIRGAGVFEGFQFGYPVEHRGASYEQPVRTRGKSSRKTGRYSPE